MNQGKDSLELFETTSDEYLVRFRVRPGTDDVGIIHEVSFGQHYNNARALLGVGSVVIDVGAHIGSFSVLSAVQGARVVALEPVPANYALLSENADLNGCRTRVKALNVAAWSSAGERTMRVADDSTGGSGFYYRRETVPTVAVRCIRLDELMDVEGITVCDLLKLDCEGAEFEILSTMNQETWRRIRNIVMEYHLWGGYSLEQLQALLVEQGFLIDTQPLESVGGILGHILAVRPPDTLPMLLPLDVTLAESQLTRLPLIGRLWCVIRRPVHGLIVFYINRMIAMVNQHQRGTCVYLRVLGQHMAQQSKTDVT